MGLVGMKLNVFVHACVLYVCMIVYFIILSMQFQIIRILLQSNMGLQISAKYTLVYQVNILLLSLMYENKDLFLNILVLC